MIPARRQIARLPDREAVFTKKDLSALLYDSHAIDQSEVVPPSVYHYAYYKNQVRVPILAACFHVIYRLPSLDPD